MTKKETQNILTKKMNTDYTEWFEKWSKELEKRCLILRVSWNGSFASWRNNCPELKQWLIC